MTISQQDRFRKWLMFLSIFVMGGLVPFNLFSTDRGRTLKRKKRLLEFLIYYSLGQEGHFLEWDIQVLGPCEWPYHFLSAHFKRNILGMWEIIMSLKHCRDLYFLPGILVEHFNFLLCDLSRKKHSWGRRGSVGFILNTLQKTTCLGDWEMPLNICRWKPLLLSFKETPCKVSNGLSFLLGQAALTQNSKGGTEHFSCLKASRAQSLR